LVKAYVVDASVVAKWFNKGETNEREALALRSGWSDGSVSLRSPALIVYEVANAIWKNSNIESGKAASLVRLLIRLSPDHVELTEDLSEEAMNLARRNKMTFYDSIYVALSNHLKLPLITADSDQLDAARNYTKALHIRDLPITNVEH
jgi:predicted nucleic acid-binding protein